MADKTANQKIKKTAIENAIKALEAVPEKPKAEVSLREAVEMMRPALKQMLDRGYNYDEIAQMLKQSEIQISGATLKQYLGARRPRQASKPGSKARSNQNGSTGESEDKSKEKLGRSPKFKDEQKDEKVNEVVDSLEGILVNKSTESQLMTSTKDEPKIKKVQSSKKSEDEFTNY